MTMYLTRTGRITLTIDVFIDNWYCTDFTNKQEKR